jgi:hypothetical protein
MRKQSIVFSIFAIAAISATSLISIQHRASSTVVTKDVVTYDCETDNNFKPESFFFTCADGNDGINKISWNTWGPMGAAGSGSRYYNDCNPSCVDGKIHSTPALVRLSTPTRVGSQIYLTLLHYSVDGGKSWSTYDLAQSYKEMNN